ncbi:MAG: PEP-CTERM sorting domain-containing protein [Armatimonadetes bacterium]|nr:PEP-CTERM sorting domain-containing protein [Armatimonadota bacterium]
MFNRQTATRWKVLIVLILGLLVLLPATAMAMLRAKWDITVADGVKTYSYYFINDIEPIYPVTTISIGMSEAGLRSIADVDLYDWEYELNYANEELVLIFAASPVRFTTLADVPTDYAREDRVGMGAWNWYYVVDVNGNSDWGFADAPLPVPDPNIPEPSSLLALGLAASGLGEVVMRRRRR